MVRLMLAMILFLSAGGMASACPVAGGSGARIDLADAPAVMTHRAQVIAGGPIDLAGCRHLPGEGNFRAEPDFSIIAKAEAAPLEFRSEADCDTMLLVAAADGYWHFDDDGAGAADARITISPLTGGRHDVWVGTFGPGTCRAHLVIRRDTG